MNNPILKVILVFFLLMCVSISCSKEDVIVPVMNDHSSTKEKKGFISAKNGFNQPIEFTNTQVHVVNNRAILSTEVNGGTISFAFDFNIEVFSLTPSFNNTSKKVCKEYNNYLLEICVPQLGEPQEFSPYKFQILVHDKKARKIEGVFEMGILYTEKSSGDDKNLI